MSACAAEWSTPTPPPASSRRAGFFGQVWRRLRHDRYAMAGLWVIGTMFALSYLAPVIANNKPIIMRWDDRTLFPAVAELFPIRYFVHYPQLTSLDFDVIKHDQSAAGPEHSPKLTQGLGGIGDVSNAKRDRDDVE